VFYRVFFYYFERFLREYEDRFEKEYGYFRPVIQDVVEKYLDCGNPMCGFARIRRSISETRWFGDFAGFVSLVEPLTLAFWM